MPVTMLNSKHTDTVVPIVTATPTTTYIRSTLLRPLRQQQPIVKWHSSIVIMLLIAIKFNTSNMLLHKPAMNLMTEPC
jgi:hypothetical protein